MAKKVKKNVKLEYFKVASRNIQNIQQSGVSDGVFDLYKWIYIFDKELKMVEDRTLTYAGEGVRLDDFQFTEDCWILCFLRLRDSNLPKKAYDNKETEDIQLDDDEYMGEEVIGIYDPKLDVLALQRNRNSLSVTGIEKYLNETWKHRDDNAIYLRPILDDVNIKAIQNKADTYYRKMRIKVADTNNTEECDYDNSPLKRILGGAKRYNGAFIDITVSMGHLKNKNLNDAAVNQTLDDIMNEPNIQKAEIYLKEGEKSPVEVVDLLQNKLYDYVQFEYELKKSIPSDVLIEHLLKQYKESRDRVKRALNRE